MICWTAYLELNGPYIPPDREQRRGPYNLDANVDYLLAYNLGVLLKKLYIDLAFKNANIFTPFLIWLKSLPSLSAYKSSKPNRILEPLMGDVSKIMAYFAKSLPNATCILCANNVQKATDYCRATLETLLDSFDSLRLLEDFSFYGSLMIRFTLGLTKLKYGSRRSLHLHHSILPTSRLE